MTIAEKDRCCANCCWSQLIEFAEGKHSHDVSEGLVQHTKQTADRYGFSCCDKPWNGSLNNHSGHLTSLNHLCYGWKEKK
jgi:hypothetical protein